MLAAAGVPRPSVRHGAAARRCRLRSASPPRPRGPPASPRARAGAGGEARRAGGGARARGERARDAGAYRTPLRKLAYVYYKSRTDVADDLKVFLLFLAVFFAVVMALEEGAGLVRGADPAATAFTSFVNLLGENLGEIDVTATSESVRVAAAFVSISGLLVFSVLIALTERTLSSAIDANLTDGPDVIECGHKVILGTFKSQRDVEGLWKVLQQTCAAYAAEGGTSVVVLSSRPKLEMEGLCLSAIPRERRQGTYIQFRRGSKLRPQDIRRVAAADASSVLVMSDFSRPPREADAQTLRCAVLLDELLAQGQRREQDHAAANRVVCETQTGQGKRMIEHYTSEFVHPINENDFNSARLARSIRSPIVAFMIEDLLGFDSPNNLYTHPIADLEARLPHGAPRLVGASFAELQARFPDAIVCGVVTAATVEETHAQMSAANRPLLSDVPSHVRRGGRFPGQVLRLGMPHPGWRASPGDGVVLLRSTALANGDVAPVCTPPPEAAAAAATNNAVAVNSADASALATPVSSAAAAEGPADAAVQRPSTAAPIPASEAGLAEKATGTGGRRNGAPEAPLNVLIVGWGNNDRMVTLLKLLDRGPCRLPKHSKITLFHKHVHAESEDDIRNSYFADRSHDEREIIAATSTVDLDAAPASSSSSSWSDTGRRSIFDPSGAPKSATGVQCPSKWDLYHPSKTDSGAPVLPPLPRMHSTYLELVNGDPLSARSMNRRLDLLSFDAVLVLKDLGWADPDLNELNGLQFDNCAADAFRLDSLTMMAQLNVREALHDQVVARKLEGTEARDAAAASAELVGGRSAADAERLYAEELRVRLERIEEETNTLVVVQKVAFEGTTRFEDRRRNGNTIGMSFQEVAARMLCTVSYNPIMQQLYSTIGKYVEWCVVPAARYAAENELLSFWQLLHRARAENMIVVGYYELPDHASSGHLPVEYFLNPQSSASASSKQSGMAIGASYGRAAAMPPLWSALQTVLRRRESDGGKSGSRTARGGEEDTPSSLRTQASLPSPRGEPRIWNRGDDRTKLILLGSKQQAQL